MNNQELIKKLAQRNAATSVVQSPKKSLLLWLGLSCLWIILGISMIGARPDLYSILIDSTFITFFFILMALAVTSAYASLSLSIPDKHARSMYWFPFLGLGGWILVLLLSMSNEADLVSQEGFLCIRDILLFSLVPALILYKRIKKGSVLNTSITGVLYALGAAGVGALGTQFTCQDGYGVHHLLWHVPPVVCLACLGVLVGKKLKIL